MDDEQKQLQASSAAAWVLTHYYLTLEIPSYPPIAYVNRDRLDFCPMPDDVPADQELIHLKILIGLVLSCATAEALLHDGLFPRERIDDEKATLKSIRVTKAGKMPYDDFQSLVDEVRQDIGPLIAEHRDQLQSLRDAFLALPPGKTMNSADIRKYMNAGHLAPQM